MNQPLANFNIQFSTHNMTFRICIARAFCKGLIRQFDEAEYEHILNSPELLYLAKLNMPQIAILILV
jgi:hypothetical protein